jgi:predicted metalloprotease with PDZ domain
LEKRFELFAKNVFDSKKFKNQDLKKKLNFSGQNIKKLTFKKTHKTVVKSNRAVFGNSFPKKKAVTKR